ncbi:MAG: hypothetical protein ACKVOR_07665 [Flavobacteriales bacterium]
MKKTTSLYLLLLSFCFVSILYSCGEKEKLPPAIFVSPGSLNIEADEGDLIEFIVTSTAGDNGLNRVVITNKPLGGITATIKDTSIVGQQSEFYFIYTVPAGATQYLLTFSVYDTDGLSATVGRNLNVNNAAYLTETTGYELFSPFHFGSNNAFKISDLTFHQLDTDPDSALIDMVEQDMADDAAMTGDLTSWSGIRFVRNNSYNYAQATLQSAEDSYTSSTPQQLITDVQVNDILITEYDTVAHNYAVIKVTGVFDDTGVNLDRYIFNVKK